MPWEIFLTDEVNGWLDDLATVDDGSYRQVVYAIEALAEVGPNLGRPLVDRIKGSAIHNLKELRPGSAGSTEVRILFVFDPWRSAVLLVAGERRATGQAGTATPSHTRNNSMRPTSKNEPPNRSHHHECRALVGHPRQAHRGDRSRGRRARHVPAHLPGSRTPAR
ncbi:MAG TPA: type II toxin-antitoxin system RelE/ParE family toxin [Pseudonocardiaceae bacterium]|nr:type II toxin-antitoxin system RelE/ParE family toxin [Pseudonocardiaceae bacterium]